MQRPRKEGSKLGPGLYLPGEVGQIPKGSSPSGSFLIQPCLLQSPCLQLTSGHKSQKESRKFCAMQNMSGNPCCAGWDGVLGRKVSGLHGQQGALPLLGTLFLNPGVGWCLYWCVPSSCAGLAVPSKDSGSPCPAAFTSRGVSWQPLVNVFELLLSGKLSLFPSQAQSSSMLSEWNRAGWCP